MIMGINNSMCVRSGIMTIGLMLTTLDVAVTVYLSIYIHLYMYMKAVGNSALENPFVVALPTHAAAGPAVASSIF